MRISGFYPTYVYNTNYVSAKSLGRVEAIPNDALKGKTDYTNTGRNTNPLRPGTSKDFAGIIASQMAMGRMNAVRIMKAQPEEAAPKGQDMTEQNKTEQNSEVHSLSSISGRNQNAIYMAMLGA